MENNTHIATDVLRFAILMLALFCACMSIAMVFVYRIRYRTERENFIHDGYGIAPPTYRALTVARLLLVGSWAFDIYQRFGEPMTWRTPVILVGMGIYAITLFRLFSSHYSMAIQRKAEVIVAKERAEKMSGAPDKEGV